MRRRELAPRDAASRRGSGAHRGTAHVGRGATSPAGRSPARASTSFPRRDSRRCARADHPQGPDLELGVLLAAARARSCMSGADGHRPPPARMAGSARAVLHRDPRRVGACRQRRPARRSSTSVAATRTSRRRPTRSRRCRPPPRRPRRRRCMAIRRSAAKPTCASRSPSATAPTTASSSTPSARSRSSPGPRRGSCSPAWRRPATATRSCSPIPAIPTTCRAPRWRARAWSRCRCARPTASSRTSRRPGRPSPRRR